MVKSSFKVSLHVKYINKGVFTIDLIFNYITILTHLTNLNYFNPLKFKGGYTLVQLTNKLNQQTQRSTMQYNIENHQLKRCTNHKLKSFFQGAFSTLLPHKSSLLCCINKNISTTLYETKLQNNIQMTNIKKQS